MHHTSDSVKATRWLSQHAALDDASPSSLPVATPSSVVPHHHTRHHPSSTHNDASFGHSPSAKTMKGIEIQPFLKQRRLPSILLDSWEFRKLASEGSVLANAMVSYDVDDDGVEEVIVGTTEGLLCVVKPDCRAPLFPRVLAATISVVLYTPIKKRLVLVTLEGQCEVTDYFLSPNRQQPRQSRTRAPSGGVDGGDSGAAASPSLMWGEGSALGALPASMPYSRSSTSMVSPLLYKAATQPATLPTHVFHVPSNCLCADLSTDADAELVFLGSYDRRFYVYSITTASCLLSLFVHDPITSVKTFTIPITAAQERKTATSSSSIFVYDHARRQIGKSRGHADGAAPLTITRESSNKNNAAMAHTTRPSLSANASTQTLEHHSFGLQTSLYVPLVFLATSTHLILLPAGLNELQQWRKLQPKSAHLPLTVQLHGDTYIPQLGITPTPGNGGELPVSSSSEAAASRQRKLSSNSEGDTAAVASGGGKRSLREAGASPAREGETPVPLMPRAARQRSGDVVEPPHQPSSSFPCSDGAAARGRENNMSSNRRGLTGSYDRPITTEVNAIRGSNSVSAASSAREFGDGGNGGGSGQPLSTEPAVPLSTSQQRRQARKRAIQAAEMGLPVLVKPLWALRIGQYTLDVPSLQAPPLTRYGVETATPAAAASEASGDAALTSGMKRTFVPTVSVNSGHEYRGSLSAASEHHTHRSSRQWNSISCGNSTSLFSISPPVSVTSAGENPGVLGERNSATHSRTGTDGDGSSRGPLHRFTVRSRHEGGEETVVSAASNTVLNSASAAGLTLDGNDGEQRPQMPQQRRPPRLHAVRTDSGNLSDDGTVYSERNNRNGNNNCSNNTTEEKSSRLRRSRSGAEEQSDGVRFSLPAAEEDDSRLEGDGLRGPLIDEESEEREVYDKSFTDSEDGSSGTSSSSCSTDADASSSSGNSRDMEDGYSNGSGNSSDSAGGNRRHSTGTCDRETITTADPSLLAKSLARIRAESVPTMLPRHISSVQDTQRTEGANVPTQQHRIDVANRGKIAANVSDMHTSLMDLANFEKKRVHGQHRHHYHHHGHHSGSARRAGNTTSYSDEHHGHAAANATTTSESEWGDVRLPISVDVSVGASQVAVALSCEDGFALELRFTVEKLSSLSRHARHRMGRAVCLYDLRHPTLPRQLGRSESRKYHGNEGSIEDDKVTLRRPLLSPLRRQQQQPQTAHLSSLPSSPMHVRGVSRMEHNFRRCANKSKNSHRPTSLICLPPPAPNYAIGSADFLGVIGNSSKAPSASTLLGTRSSSNGTTTPTKDEDTKRANTQHQKQLQLRGALRTPSPTSSLRGGAVDGNTSIGDFSRSCHHEDDRLVLRAQCLWAARLGNSPLVQRARVFCVKSHHHDNMFCTVFVTANGTCFAIDGDTLSVVECSVKEDCSSFTLMAGPCSTMTLPPTDASVHASSPSQGNGKGSAEHDPKDGSGPMKTSASANLLCGAIGRAVSCVCVSVDELCIYSVGEASQLVQHRDALHVTLAPTETAAEPMALLSQRPYKDPSTTITNTSAKEASTLHTLDDNAMISSPLHLDRQQLRVDRRINSRAEAVIADEDGAAAFEAEEKALLRLLAQRLKEYEKHVPAASAMSSGGETFDSEETEEAMLLRVKRLLLYGYSDVEWERLKWLDHGVT